MSQSPVFVNPLRVTHVATWTEHVDECIVYVDGHHSIAVVGTAFEVSQKVQSALEALCDL